MSRDICCYECDHNIKPGEAYVLINGDIHCLDCAKSYLLDELNDALTNTFEDHFEDIADICGYQILEVG